jgi:hypothetical protein
MYIPYRKAYLTGMNPLSFLTFFTVGELVTMIALAVGYKGATALWQQLMSARSLLFWLMLGGFVWVIGDLFQQYAAKYVGISRGIPLSNTNQLWGLLWGILVFHELQGGNRTVYSQVIGGSVLMGLGALAIALSSAGEPEHSSWRDAAEREGQRYGVEEGYVRAGLEGREFEGGGKRRTLIDCILIAGTTAVFVVSAAVARVPRMDMHLTWAAALAAAMLLLLVSCGITVWRTTGFR